ncbi:MAG: zf-TFIIB domain-containing protein [Nitrospinota bacterium]|nr:zf-TFIIB domain-containing protein [Nitrospinota bacterium]
MNCPACNNEMKALSVTGVKVQACEGSCGGLWFEWREIKKLKDRIAGAGAVLLHVERAEGVHIFRDVQHPCPHCIHSLLYRHCFSREFHYEIDQCAKCAGFWVDVGALSGLPLQSPTEKDRQKAAAYFKNLFEKNLKPQHLAHPDTHEAAQTIHQLYRFFTPPTLFPAE